MFGILNFENGKCFGIEETDLPLEDYYQGHKVIAFAHAVVAKDYINSWKSGHKCEHEECFRDGCVECHVPEDPMELPAKDLENKFEYLCPDHAYEAGYCSLCGSFWGGIESFDFNNPSHLCEHCLEQVKDEIGENDDINGGD